jgi:two-component system, chemotaxis family, protein-glutamate methylesterase/glutaminase
MSAATPPWLVAIGASGGEGLRDIEQVLAALPVPLPAMLLVVLHRPWGRPSDMRCILARKCPHPVVIGDASQTLEAGTVYIGEPAQHLALASRNLGVLIDDPHRAYGNRTIDLLFSSLAEHATGGGGASSA